MNRLLFNQVVQVIEECGVIFENDEDYIRDLSLLAIDSIMYVTLLVAIENKFEIEFPDSFFSFDTPITVKRIYEQVEEQAKNKKCISNKND